MAQMLRRILTGDGMRTSRFHDYHGNLIDLWGLRFLPRSVLSAVGLRLFAYRSATPWLGYRAIRHINSILNCESVVLEYGSGMSTLWFARRAGRVVSIETDGVWFSKIREKLESARHGHVTYLLSEVDQVPHVESVEDSSFDLVLVDGLTRDQVMKAAIRKVKPGGYVYLDNSDVPYPEFQGARQILIEAAGDEADVQFFRDFCPGQVSVTEGMLVRMPSK